MRIFTTFLFIYASVALIAQEYNIGIDLTKMKNDRVPVEIEFNDFKFDESVEYHMPKSIPGTYSISDFGRVINDFKAFDINGNELSVNKLDINRWEINEAAKLTKINYWVDDTFDEKRFSDIFEPAGSNIEENNFLINNFAFVGFIKGEEKLPYSIRIIHPERLYGASPMKREVISEVEEVFYSDNYLQLTDSPIMYSPPDTASVMIGDTQVMVSVYSPSRDSIAAFMMNEVESTLRAQGKYLGGDLPVKNYVVLIYLHENNPISGLIGALEHSYSTVLSFPDYDPIYLSQTLIDVTAHEFFHIITPLTIHSEEIGDYNFIEPEMSKHLWLYEGVTEYSSMRVQVMYDLISEDLFLEEIVVKIEGAEKYNDSLPFTVMSKGVLDEYEDEYANVYEKGALIGMCLDLLLLDLSDGEYDIRELLNDLSKKYGINRSFKDEDLFDVIETFSFPEIRVFFQRYIEGSEPLPIKEYLQYAGADFFQGESFSVNTIGGILLAYDAEQDALVVVDASHLDKFGDQMGYEVGDVLISFIGKKINFENYHEIFKMFYQMEEGEKVEMLVKRTDKKGRTKNKKLKGKITQEESVLGQRIEWSSNPSEKQLRVRNAWVNVAQ